MNRSDRYDVLPMLALFAFAAAGIAILLWLGRIPDAELTAAYTTLIGIADWLVKASVGAILGLAGTARLRSRKAAGELG